MPQSSVFPNLSTLFSTLESVLFQVQSKFGSPWLKSAENLVLNDIGVLNSILISILTTIILLVYSRYRAHGLFKRLNIDGPKPHFIYGNLHQLGLGHGLKSLQVMEEWTKRHGKIYGYYRGAIPCLVVTDLQFLKKILIGDYSKFIDRHRDVLSLKAIDHSLVGLKGPRWREVRSILSPTFGATKIKMLDNSMNGTVDIFMAQLQKRVGTEFDFYDLFQRLTVQVICDCALGFKGIDSLTDENDEMFITIREFMRSSGHPLSYFLMYFPCFGPVARLLMKNLKIKGVDNVVNKILEIIEQRKAETSCANGSDASVKNGKKANNGKTKCIDVVQMMLDVTDALKSNTGKKISKPLCDYEIASNAWLFLLAGFETTATALTYVAHVLATRSDVQDEVYREIEENIPAGPDEDHRPSYEDVGKLPYLEKVINETLRMYPPVVLFMNRVASEDYKLGDITIPKGMMVEVPIYNIQHDPDNWHDPETFDPERFDKSNKNFHSMANLMFGSGPRSCIGVQFGKLEMKCTLVRMLRLYRLVPTEKTVNPPDIYVPYHTMIPKAGLFIKLERRKAN